MSLLKIIRAEIYTMQSQDFPPITAANDHLSARANNFAIVSSL
jgi:hypothetical protein